MAKTIGLFGMLCGLLISLLGLWWQVECDAGRAPCCIEIAGLKCTK